MYRVNRRYGGVITGTATIALLVTFVVACAYATERSTPEGNPDRTAKSVAGARSNLAADESLLFFPTLGGRESDGEHWRLTISGWVFEPGDNKIARSSSRKLLGQVISADTPEERALLEKRLSLFFVDNERGKSIAVRLGNGTYRLRSSTSDGRFSGTIRLSTAAVKELLGGRNPAGQWLSYDAVLPVKDKRVFRGKVQLVAPDGVCVVSDIDDTIKISQVHQKALLLKNTFAKKYQAVPGMAALYRRWDKEGASFHYLSNSPLPLYEALAQFLAADGFPDGTVHLRPFRWKDGTFLKLLSSSTQHKESTLAALAKQFPTRRFVLVGDCGEQDPMIYAKFARQHPGRVVRIYLRAPLGKATRAQWQETFQGLPAELWSIFHAGEEIKGGVVEPQ